MPDGNQYEPSKTTKSLVKWGTISAVAALGYLAWHYDGPISNYFSYISYNTIVHQDGRPVRKLRPSLDIRGKELRDQLLVRQLLRFGFECANGECTGTANGFTISKASTVSPWPNLNRGINDPGKPKQARYIPEYVPGESREERYFSYEFTPVANPKMAMQITLQVTFEQVPRFGKMGFDIYEIVSTNYRSVHYVDNRYVHNGVRSGPIRETKLTPTQADEQVWTATFAPLLAGLNMRIPTTSPTCHQHKLVETFRPSYSINIPTRADILTSGELDKAGCWEHRTRRDNLAVRPAMANGRPVQSNDWPISLSVFFN